MTDILLGAESAALIIAVLALIIQHYSHKADIEHHGMQVQRALDRANAAELRSAQQIDAMLDRISTSPRIQFEPQKEYPKIDPNERRYIADHPADDEAWNEYRGVTEEDVDGDS